MNVIKVTVQCGGSDKYKDMRTQAKRKVKRKINNKNNRKEEKHTKKAPMEFQVYIHSIQRDADLENRLCSSPFVNQVYKRMECPVYFKHTVSMHTMFSTLMLLML